MGDIDEQHQIYPLRECEDMINILNDIKDKLTNEQIDNIFHQFGNKIKNQWYLIASPFKFVDVFITTIEDLYPDIVNQ